MSHGVYPRGPRPIVIKAAACIRACWLRWPKTGGINPPAQIISPGAMATALRGHVLEGMLTQSGEHGTHRFILLASPRAKKGTGMKPVPRRKLFGKCKT